VIEKYVLVEYKSIRSIATFLTTLDKVGVNGFIFQKESWLTLEKDLIKTCDHRMNHEEFSYLLEACSMLLEKRQISKPVFKALFSHGNPLLAKKLQDRLLEYIEEFGKAKFDVGCGPR
jgi:hypothetical protein